MHLSLFKLALVAFSTSQLVAAHTVFTTLFVNDVSQGDGTCVRMPSDPSTATFPINDLDSDSMACGFNGTKGVDRVCSVNQTAKLSFLFREYADGSKEGAIDPNHKGPCAVYMKRVASAINDTAVGPDWFKIWDEGYDNNTKKWCTEKLIQNNGYLSVNIPSDLAGGYYLARPELLALHQADKTPPNPQFYVGCAQIYLNSAETSVPKATVSIPGYVNISDPSVLYNIWNPPPTPYTMPGPAPYQPGISVTDSITGKKAVKFSAKQTQNEGLLPPDAVLTNANWWGVEVTTYTTEQGCWNASSDCWNQTTVCYDSAPPTGDKGCRDWETHCKAIQEGCQEGNFNGPPVLAKMTGTTAMAPTMVATIAPAVEQTGGVYAAGSTVVSAGSLKVSVDGSCGGGEGQTCRGSSLGECCSQAGYCGSSGDYCGTGCQGNFGVCG
ncbi:hypothetical protein SS1G_08493 [Sclerotinia sclerotiorum 1980 UF-70]|uniref:AA9 family lytic polysaccharide monooxygenase n=2 Tax=Sclerotinia sclerotiorum (strain ATCC 18683 / 1980 / Ss-1) TaxID=665079 RepID=A7ET38_SCLS1|nr:hypothetical protein SS1G_08493 [Sclerotinia sclerotiorum 1980 UF-70]APA12997.1 hypothetical protein sscle_10g077670 [Sclerotinia sclerotiorum 1980 UF-70]EDN92630.1 hypothetical protein SS1G_08493 [Sclerotinia sclerotiorum 1980 UF-70]